MGMYDTFWMPQTMLPDGQCYNCEFQSKSFDCDGSRYSVTGDGRVQKMPPFGEIGFYKPSDLTGTGWLRGDNVDVKAVFSRGRLVSLEMEE